MPQDKLGFSKIRRQWGQSEKRATIKEILFNFLIKSGLRGHNGKGGQQWQNQGRNQENK